MEMAYLLGGSLAWTIAENKMGFRKSASAPAPAEIPRAASFEAPTVPKMRPPSNTFTAPKWGAQETKSPVKQDEPEESAPAPAPAPQPSTTQLTQPVASVAIPAPPAPQASEEMLKKLSEQNQLVIQLLQTMATTKMVTPKRTSPEPSPRLIRIKHTMSTGRKSTKAASTVHKEEVLNLDD
jgi:hypothetical protein